MYIGDFPLGATIRRGITFNSAAGARVDPNNAIETADIEIYKNGSATQRASDVGVTFTNPFDSMTGTGYLSIDTSDNTDAGFWTPQSDYTVFLYPDETIDSQSVAAVMVEFSIENRFVPGLMKRTTIATLASQTSFTLTAGSADNDAYNDCQIIVQDATTIEQKCVGTIGDYTGATKTVTMKANPAVFTMAVGDYVTILAPTDHADVRYVRGNAVPTPTVNGVLDSNITHWLGTAAATPTVAGVPEVDMTHWLGTVVATPTVAGVPEVDVTHWNGTAVAAPTTAGVPEVDITYWNGVAVADFVNVVTDNGTAQAGAASTITLRAAAPSVDLVGSLVLLTGGTGAKQARRIIAYNTTTKVATVDRAWGTNPDATSTYAVLAESHVTTSYRLRKNTTLSAFPFVMTDASTGQPKTGLTVTAQRSLDGGALASMANAPTEVSNGLYKVDLAAADTNADTVVYRFTATGANDLILVYVTQA